MKRRDFLYLSASALAAPRAGAAGGGAAPDFSWLDARLRERVDNGYFDGMGLVIGRGERILHEAYAGDGGPDVVRHVASTGKWTAAATIAVLVDEGRLRWDEPVRKFLPQFTDAKGSATLRQLLSHTAGYPDYQPEGRRRDDYPTLEEAVAHIVDLPAAAAPGEVFRYGGLAMQVAGRMAELAAGMPFDAIFRSRIAGPLGMRHSGYAPVSTEPGFNPMLGGSLFTTTRDFARFLMMIARGGVAGGKRILSARAIAELEADQVRGARVKRGEYVELARQDTARTDIYGLGQWREEVDRDGRPLLLSSPGWAGAYAWVDRACDVWGVVIAKANVGKAVADGYSTFLGSSIYAPMVRTALAQARDTRTKRALVPVDGGKLYYEDSGSGAPVIFLHGHSFDRRQWQPQVEALERGHRVIRYDLRGYGRSSAPQEDAAFLHADDLRQFMDALGIRRAHLVGLSLGGFVVTDFIGLYPDRALSATMAGGDLFDVPGPDEPWTAEALARRRADIAALKAAGVAPFKRRWLEDLVGHGGSGREALRQPLWRMIDEWRAWQPLHVEPRLLLGRAAPGRLADARPSMPVLIVRGDLEKIDLAIKAWLPQAEVVVIPDCGHVSNLEQPATFTATLRRFLARV
ncbi:class A beta-lactamase-related serine hydrolase [Telluria mixta]|uniref:Class A beta-lactamase-related serine hydrolase n=1 Tax=Telluria mixta TaxID=34071 RepID=A0ABT2BSS4_9BURK|nr:class A beta-lactamase-related serine hydrolase [Telluria mixta]MCS0628170.1 class A beta-lactamase-related serine hydrolase [Telluria mixta]WEM93714.1 class A beta-lactamase-related serine hydrolase [Telluria mixta]